MLPVDGGSDRVEVQTPTAHMVSGHLSDTEIANAMVHAIRAIPGVLNMGQGLFAKSVTYGPGKHIEGIALQHPTPGDLSIEVHVVLDVRFLNTALSDVNSSSETTPILLRLPTRYEPSYLKRLNSLVCQRLS